MTKAKKVTAIMLFVVCVFMLTTTLPCYASNDIVITPRWNNVSNVYVSLQFYGDAGEATASMDRGNSVTSLEGTLTIYENDNSEWVYVDSITKSTTRTTLNMLLEFDGTSGVEYKLELAVTAYSGTTVMEEITDTKYATCP